MDSTFAPSAKHPTPAISSLNLGTLISNSSIIISLASTSETPSDVPQCNVHITWINPNEHGSNQLVQNSIVNLHRKVEARHLITEAHAKVVQTS